MRQWTDLLHFKKLIMNHWYGKIHLLCFLLARTSFSYGAAQCDNVNNMNEVTKICPSTKYQDNCVVVVMYSDHADCEAFCTAAGSSCLDAWDSHGGSCDNIDQTDDTWPQGCGGDNLFHDGICMCAADGSSEDGGYPFRNIMLYYSKDTHNLFLVIDVVAFPFLSFPCMHITASHFINIRI